MKFLELLKFWKNDFIMRWKDFFKVCGVMYKDKVDLGMHLAMVAVFIWGFFTNVDMMAAVGFFGVYAFGATFRATVMKIKIHDELLNKE